MAPPPLEQVNRLQDLSRKRNETLSKSSIRKALIVPLPSPRPEMGFDAIVEAAHREAVEGKCDMARLDRKASAALEVFCWNALISED